MNEWYDDRAEEYIEFDPIQPGEVEVTDPEPTGLLDAKGEPMFHDRPPFGFQPPA